MAWLLLTHDSRRKKQGFSASVPEISLRLNGHCRQISFCVRRSNPSVFFALSMWLQAVEQNRTSLFCFFIVCDLVVQHGCVDGRRKKRVSVPGA